MADSKITQLTALTTVDALDVLPVVDVSVGTTKKVTKDNLFKAVNMTGDCVLNIYTDTTASLGVGYQALDARTTGSYNTALGTYTLTDLTEGTYNTAVGFNCGADITTGNYNVSLGSRGALGSCTTGSGNIAVGGYVPLGAVTTGAYNIGIGYFAGHYFEEGDYNILIGHDAGNNFTGSSTADNNIVIGKQAQTTSGTSSNEIILGNTSHDYFSIPGVGFKIDNGNVAIGAASPTAKLDVYSGVLGTSDGDQLEQARFRSTTTNASYLRIFTERDGAGSAWTTAFTRIQQRIDTSDHGYVQFSGADNVAGMSFGIGNNEAMRITSSGNVGIGASPVHELDVVGDGARSVVRANTTASNARLEAQASNYWSGSTYTGTALIQYGSTATGTTAGLSNANLGALSFQNCSGGLIYTNGANPIIFGVTSIERMRIDAGGNVGIGTDAPYGRLTLGSPTGAMLYMEDGSSSSTSNRYITLGHDNGFRFQTRNSSGAFVSNDYLVDNNASGATSHRWQIANVEKMRIDSSSVRPGADNSQTLGANGARWSVVWAATGTISTSDEREKQQIADLDDAERRVAIALKGLVKKFKYNDAVSAKGDDARIHVGVIAQEVVAAFAAEGLDATRYALLCYDEWDAEPERVDKEGNVVQAGREAGSRYGIRYDELLAFIIAAL
jgi:hypothetical protein